ncbi:trehalose-phosphatase [Lacibacterium aquatile]|uniref:Trehalose 6-phosphate phosphatase n=1 Tax=Lacibacterium aquatile TaxID=1168082 RepID=A0ABW5DRR8_9PROT
MTLDLDRLQLERCAFFLDVDGTLIDIAASPQEVVIPPDLVQLLHQLQNRTQGALALVSGRSVDDLRQLLPHLDVIIAGEHGAEIWRPGETPQNLGAAPIPHELTEALEKITHDFDGVVLERKPRGRAIHFRAIPTQEYAVRDAVALAVKPFAQRFEVVPGKMVAEVRTIGIDKGQAIAKLMQDPTFKGRLPVFAGDDVTDEAGFLIVRAHGGAVIRVGGAPRADLDRHFETPAELRGWLSRCVTERAPA